MDYLIKALAFDDSVRVYLANTKEIANTAKKHHDLWPGALSVLGKTMTITAMMGAMLKGEETATVKLLTNGPIGNIIVDANANGILKGYVDHPHINFIHIQTNTLSDSFALGDDATLQVIKDLKLKDYFTSSIPLQTGDLAKDFTYYFTVSEQTPSAIGLGIQIEETNEASVSGGFLIQVMPNASEEVIDFLEQNLSRWEQFSSLLKTHTLEEILALMFDQNVRILETLPLEFRCNCSREKFAAGLKTLQANELSEIIEEDGHAETICHFCRQVYTFSKEELLTILEEKNNESK